MKKKLLVVLLTVLLGMMSVLTACSDGAKDFSDETKTRISDAVKEGVEQAFASYMMVEEIPDELKATVDELSTIAADKTVAAFVASGMTESEVKKLLDITVDPTNPDAMVLLEEFQATGVNGTKISKFMWSLVTSVDDVIQSIDESFMVDPTGAQSPAEVKESILEEYNKALSCITEAEFTTIVSTIMDYSIASLESSLELSDMIMGIEERPTLNEFKAIVEETKASGAELDNIMSDNFLAATASVLKKGIAAYYLPGAENATLRNEYNAAIDRSVNYIKVLKKVDAAMYDAIDTDMIEVLYNVAVLGDYSETSLIVMIGKLLNAAVDTSANGTGTGFTKSFILSVDLEVFGVPMVGDMLDEAGIDIDLVFADLAYFADVDYDVEELDEGNIVVAMIYAALEAAESTPKNPIEEGTW